jgi:hypothetical protein
VSGVAFIQIASICMALRRTILEDHCAVDKPRESRVSERAVIARQKERRARTAYEAPKLSLFVL